MRIQSALVVALAACGGSKHAKDPHDAALDAAEAQRKELEAAKPARPYETRERIAYRASERCGQGPYRIETDSLQAHYGEQLIVYACGAHAISGNTRLSVERKGSPTDTSESAFGFGTRDNAACRASRPVEAQPGTAAAGGSSATTGGPATAGTAAAAAATAKPTTLARTGDAVTETCTAVRTSIYDLTYTTDEDRPAFKGHVVIDIWSDEPNDLDDLVFVFERRVVAPGMTLERWHAFQQADRAWTERYIAFIDGEVAAGRSTLIDSKVKSPPPPPPRAEPPPPRPSKNARWIPGYWRYDTGTFHWIAGLWDVPAEDVAQDLTVHAPAPPPAPKLEQPAEPQPTTTAVWTQGQWQWDGRAYVWIAGAWRIPPSTHHTWQPSGWTIRAGGAVYVPGGWRVQLRR